MNLLNNLNSTLLFLGVPTEQGGTAFEGMLGFFMPMALLVLVFYFLLIRPERKRSKKAKEMRENVQIADEVVTSGGIIGRVVSVKDDTVLIETGGDRTRIRVLKSAIAENRTIHDS